MGSFLHSKMFPKAKLEAFQKAFSQIPQRVIWKWESDTMSIQSDKVFTAPWLPQRDILGNLNIQTKVFRVIDLIENNILLF